MEKIKEWVQNYVTENPNSDGATAWAEFTKSKIGKKFVNDTTTENYIKGFVSRIGAENAGVTNDKGQMSKKENPAVFKLDNKESELKLLPDNIDTQALVKGFEVQKNKVLGNINGKSKEEQEDIVSESIKEEKPEEEQKEKPKKDIVFTPKVPGFSNTAKEIEQAERNEEIDKKESAFLKSWASTHPTWREILSSKDLSWGQKVALVGSALANIGANVTLGAKAGFEHGSFNGVPWDFKQAVDKYTENEIDKALTPEQEARGKTNAATFWGKYREENGEEKTEELIALVDLYGDNPETLSSRLKSLGINKSAKEAKELYANLEKTNLSESIKQKKLETESQIYDNFIKALMADERFKTNDSVIKARNAINDLQTTSATFDEKTYKLRKIGGMVKDVLETVEGAAATAGGILTGGVVGKVKDGIVKAPGMAQKIVRADGTEIELDPNDNIYATKNKLTTGKDNGGDIIHMTQDDEVITLQKKLGYSGGMIRKDFEYYLNKLRG